MQQSRTRSVGRFSDGIVKLPGATGLRRILALALIVTGMLHSGCATSTGSGGGSVADSGGGSDNDDTTTPQGAEREIEEADIIKEQDGYFYIANPYKGLRIIDVSAIERPELVGGVAVMGRGVELFVDDDRAFMITSADFFACAGKAVSFEDAQIADALFNPDYEGSRITVADVSDPAAPFEIAHFDMDGFITATRRVGNIIYAAGNFDDTFDSGDDADDLPTNGPPDDSGDEPPLPSSTGVAITVFEDGDVAEATSPAGIKAQFRVDELFQDAGPNPTVQTTVTDGNIHSDYAGIPDAIALLATASFEGTIPDGQTRASVIIEFDAALLPGLAETPDDLAVYRFDDQTQRWQAAATNFVGISGPNGVANDFGYLIVQATGNIRCWATVDRLGDYAVGLRFSDELVLTVADAAGGQVTVEPDQAVYAYGQTVTLTALPDAGFVFSEWVGAAAGLEEIEAGTLEFVLTEDTTVSAAFVDEASIVTGPAVFVVSIDISDPDDIRIVDRVNVAGESLDIHVTANAIYVLGDDPDMANTTRVTYVDISDPAGTVLERDSFRVPGNIGSRFFASEFEDTFRIITEDRSLTFNPIVALYLYDIIDPDDVIRVGRLTIETGESLRSVRFDGDRAYAVTFLRIDPLFVLDLADPENPRVAGELEVPGWSTHLVPLGDRLVGVGFDDAAGLRPAVTLYDVADIDDPRRLSRVVLGERWTFGTTSEATVDEKALQVLESEELILIPFSSFDADQGLFVESLQLIDLRARTILERGFIEHRGLVRRAGVTDTRLWILSDEAFQVADIDDRDEVAPMDVLDIMSEQELLDAGLADCVDSARFGGLPVDAFFFGSGDVIFLSGRGPCGVGTLGAMFVLLAAFAPRMIRRR